MSTAVPSDVMGLESKWNSPSMAAQADSFGFYLHGQTMFTQRSIWGRNLHQWAMGKSGGKDAVVDLKQDL